MAGVLRDAPPSDPAAPLPADLEPLVREFLGSEFADALLQLLDPEGRVRSRALRPGLPLSREARINALRGAPTLETVDLTTGEQARLLTMPVVRGGRVVDLVQVAMPLRRTRQALIRYVETLAVLYLDLDNFKSVNDTLGHQTGDELLSQLAIRLSEVRTGEELCARLGGDEFAIVFVDANESQDEARIGNYFSVLSTPFLLVGGLIEVRGTIG